jgi:DNA-binding XRE family transcriptional regulator
VFIQDQRNLVMTISSDERDFFVALGARIALLRKARSVTQVQLAEALEVSQQTIQAYEVGRRRIPVSALPAFSSKSRPSASYRRPGNALCRKCSTPS